MARNSLFGYLKLFPRGLKHATSARIDRFKQEPQGAHECTPNVVLATSTHIAVNVPMGQPFKGATPRHSRCHLKKVAGSTLPKAEADRPPRACGRLVGRGAARVCMHVLSSPPSLGSWVSSSCLYLVLVAVLLCGLLAWCACLLVLECGARSECSDGATQFEGATPRHGILKLPKQALANPGFL